MTGQSQPRATSIGRSDAVISSVTSLNGVCQGCQAFYTRASTSATDIQLKSVFMGIGRSCESVSTYHKVKLNDEELAAGSDLIHPLARWYYLALLNLEEDSTQALLGKLVKHEQLVLNSIDRFCEHQTRVDIQVAVADTLARVQTRVDVLRAFYTKQFLQ